MVVIEDECDSQEFLQVFGVVNSLTRIDMDRSVFRIIILIINSFKASKSIKLVASCHNSIRLKAKWLLAVIYRHTHLNIILLEFKTTTTHDHSDKQHTR